MPGLDITDGGRHAQIDSDGDQDEVFDHQGDGPQLVRASRTAPVVTTSISDIVKQDSIPADVQTVPSMLAAPSTPLQPSMSTVLAVPSTPMQPSTSAPSTASTGKSELLKYSL